MTKKTDPLLKAENRSELLSNGIKEIEIQQRQMIREAKKYISDSEIQNFQQHFDAISAQYKLTQEEAEKIYLNSKTMIDNMAETSLSIENFQAIAKQAQEAARKLEAMQKVNPIIENHI